MVQIELNLNKSINPCIVTSSGDYVPNSHQLYISCNSLEKELYQTYGWYLGCVFIGSKTLNTIKKEAFSQILTEIESSINLNLEGSINELHSLVIGLVEKVIELINTKQTLDEPIKIITDNLKI